MQQRGRRRIPGHDARRARSGCVVTAVLNCRSLTAGYGDLAVVRDFDVDLAAGRVLVGARPERRGQDNAARHDGRSACLASPARWSSTATALPSGRPARGEPRRRRARTRRPCAVHEAHGRREPAGRGAEAVGQYDDVVDLFPALRRRWKLAAGALSGGEQQMLAMARALVQRPRVLLIDEMSMGLAPVIVEELLPIVRRRRRRHGRGRRARGTARAPRARGRRRGDRAGPRRSPARRRRARNRRRRPAPRSGVPRRGADLSRHRSIGPRLRRSNRERQRRRGHAVRGGAPLAQAPADQDRLAGQRIGAASSARSGWRSTKRPSRGCSIVATSSSSSTTPGSRRARPRPAFRPMSGWSMPAASRWSAPTTPTPPSLWPTRSTPARCQSSVCAAPTRSTVSSASGWATATSAANRCSSLRGSCATATQRAAVLAPWTPISEEYFRFFRQECRRARYRHRGRREHAPAHQRRGAQPTASASCATPNADALVWLGYGGMVVDFTVRRAARGARLGPAPHHDHRVHAIRVGHGPARGLDRHRPVVSREPAHASLLRAVLERGTTATRSCGPTPSRVSRTTWRRRSSRRSSVPRSSPVRESRPVSSASGSSPACTGGPNTHIAGGPFDHQMFKGDWLHYGRVRDGKLEFAGLYEPIS